MAGQPLSFSNIVHREDHHLELRKGVAKLVGSFGRPYFQDIVKRGDKASLVRHGDAPANLQILAVGQHPI